MRMDARHRFNTPLFWWMLIAVPTLIHFFLLYRYAANAPRLDDFSEVLTFLPNFYDTAQWHEKIRSFFSVYQDHRYGVTHALNLLTDGINFRTYTLWGNLLLPAYVYLFWRALSKHPLKKEITIFAAFLFFNLQTWYGSYWASILLTSLGSLPIALGTFLLICSPNPRLIPCAVFCAICLTYTLGNGVLVWPLAVMYSLLDNRNKQQTLWDKRTLTWLVAGIIILTTYFYDFHFFNKEGHGGTTSAIDFLWQAFSNTPRIAIGFFSLAGSHLLYYSGQTDWRIVVAATIGALETLALLWLIWKGALRTHPALLLLLAFAFLTMLSIAVARAATINLGQALQGHYKLYTATYLLLLIVAVLDWVQENKSSRTQQSCTLFFCCVALLYIASLFLFIPTVKQYHGQLAEDTEQWLYSNTLQRGETKLFVKQPNKKLLRAVKGNFYNPWTLLSDQEIPTDIIYSATCPQPATQITAKLQSQARALAVHIDTELTPVATQKMCLQSTKQAIFFTLPEKATTLWVPRNPEIEEDSGPWALYALP